MAASLYGHHAREGGAEATMAAKAMVCMAEIGKTGRGLPVYRALLKGVSFLLTTSKMCDRIKNLVVSTKKQ